jgi:hypothetical protein
MHTHVTWLVVVTQTGFHPGISSGGESSWPEGAGGGGCGRAGMCPPTTLTHQAPHSGEYSLIISNTYLGGK